MDRLTSNHQNIKTSLCVASRFGVKMDFPVLPSLPVYYCLLPLDWDRPHFLSELSHCLHLWKYVIVKVFKYIFQYLKQAAQEKQKERLSLFLDMYVKREIIIYRLKREIIYSGFRN